MSAVKEKTTKKTTTQAEAKTQPGPAQAEVKPVFDEIEGMSQAAALNVVLQAAEMAQGAGALTIRDAVILAKAITILRPGSI